MNVFNNKLTIIGAVTQGTLTVGTDADTIARIGASNKEDRQWIIIRNLTNNRAIYWGYNPNPTSSIFIIPGGATAELKANGIHNIYLRGEQNNMSVVVAEL